MQIWWWKDRGVASGSKKEWGGSWVVLLWSKKHWLGRLLHQHPYPWHRQIRLQVILYMLSRKNCVTLNILMVLFIFILKGSIFIRFDCWIVERYLHKYFNLLLNSTVTKVKNRVQYFATWGSIYIRLMLSRYLFSTKRIE